MRCALATIIAKESLGDTKNCEPQIMLRSASAVGRGAEARDGLSGGDLVALLSDGRMMNK